MQIEELAEENVAEKSIVPSAAGGAAILASALAGFGLAKQSDDSDDSEEENSEDQSVQQAETPQLEVPQLITPQLQQPETEPEEVETFVNYDEAAESEIESEAETESSQPDEPESEPSAPPTIASDPFADDSFDAEEVLTDAYSPFVAHQNQRSLDVTSEQLQSLTPQDVESPSEKQAPEVKQEESFPTFESAMQPPEPVRDPVLTQFDPRDKVETHNETESPDPESPADEFAVNRLAASLAASVATDSDDVETPVADIQSEYVEANPGSGFVPLDPDAVLLSDEIEAESNAESEPHSNPAEPVASSLLPPTVDTDSSSINIEECLLAPSAIRHPEVQQPSNAAPGFHEQTSTPDDPEIRRQAKNIIEALAAGSLDDTVSHETTASPEPVQAETNAITNLIQRTIDERESQPEGEEASTPSAAAPVVMPQIDDIQNSLKEAQLKHGFAKVPQVQPIAFEPENTEPEPVEPPVADEPISPEQQILDEINSQVATMPPLMLEPSTLPLPEPSPEASSGEDDRDILSVNQEIPVPETNADAKEDAPMPAWSQEEPSQGDASRVDYQQLFDQLRNVKPSQE